MRTLVGTQIGATALVVGSMLSLTAGASLAKRLFSIAGADGVSAVRIGFGALILCIVWRAWRFRLSRSEIKAVLLYGISLGLMNLLFYNAIALLPIGLAIAIEFLGPLSIALVFSRKRVDFLWATLATCGVVLILPVTEISDPIDPKGVLFALGAALAWALYILLGKKAGSSVHHGSVTSLGMLTGFFIILPFGARDALPLFSSTHHMLIALAVGILSSAIPYSLEMSALKTLPERHFGLLMSLEPAIGAAIAFLLLGERLTQVQGAAIACVVGASIGSSYTHRS